MVLKLQQQYEGFINRACCASQAAGRKPHYIWQVRRMQAHRMLEKVVPYMVQKADQGRLALEFRSLVGDQRNISEEMKQKQIEIKRRLAAMKR
jgi:hypothetical protein